MLRSIRNLIAAPVAALFLLPALALAQITVGTLTGRVVDESGGVVVGARVDLIARRKVPGPPRWITNATGDYMIPNLPPTRTVSRSAPRRSSSCGTRGS